jgi:hypothetical protein
MRKTLCTLVLTTSLASPAIGGETISYSYDARGRLINAARSGSINDGLSTSYQFDKADNRVGYTASGGSGQPGTGTGGVSPAPGAAAAIIPSSGGYRTLPFSRQ